ncbi:DUF6183 family protein [Streptomyces albidoflavus]|uniref:DUF6183 family protein n=1 Tax=Streptomyces albidoflavus TaxID=1886 RepID=UPI00363EEE26|nr:DUF6183 family protein [Streptomyces albidoflavus]
MTERIQEIVAGLPELKDVAGVCAVADERVARGDAAFAADLGVALARAYGRAEPLWQYRSLFGHLLRLLATTAGPQNVTEALRLVSSPEAADRRRDRHVASLLASCRRPEELAVVFSGHASEELRACLVDELVLRGVAVDEEPGIARWARSPHWRYHPLGWLPLTRSGMEDGADLPSYSLRGSSHAMPYGPSEGVPYRGTGGARVPSAAEVTTPQLAAALSSAVANWAEESNGVVEARVFDLAGQPADEAVPATLLTLRLESLAGAGRKKAALSVTACPPGQAWRVLFAAASTGGAYNSGSHGAYGRLAAWQSLAALAGVADGAGSAEVEARAAECAWFGFDARTDWFEQVAWDIGLAALAPDRRRLAVLAATDTD